MLRISQAAGDRPVGEGLPQSQLNSLMNTMRGAVAICWLLLLGSWLTGLHFWLLPGLWGLPRCVGACDALRGVLLLPQAVLFRCKDSVSGLGTCRWLQRRVAVLPGAEPPRCLRWEGLSELGAALAQTGVPACIPAACPGLSTGVYGGYTQCLEMGCTLPAPGIPQGSPAAPS